MFDFLWKYKKWHNIVLIISRPTFCYLQSSNLWSSRMLWLASQSIIIAIFGDNLLQVNGTASRYESIHLRAVRLRIQVLILNQLDIQPALVLTNDKHKHSRCNADLLASFRPMLCNHSPNPLDLLYDILRDNVVFIHWIELDLVHVQVRIGLVIVPRLLEVLFSLEQTQSAVVVGWCLVDIDINWLERWPLWAKYEVRVQRAANFGSFKLWHIADWQLWNRKLYVVFIQVGRAPVGSINKRGWDLVSQILKLF